MRQILVNLLKNAVRHSPENGTVVVQLHDRDPYLEVDVIDRGDGIPAGHIATIFEAFERAGERDERGTGLGLTLSRHLARRLGGDLLVESQEGNGASFTLRLRQTGDSANMKGPS